MELPFQPPTFTWLQSLTDHEKLKVKQNIFKSLSTSLLPGFVEAKVLHRDLKTDNLLYLPFSEMVVACDFGVSFMAIFPALSIMSYCITAPNGPRRHDM